MLSDRATAVQMEFHYLDIGDEAQEKIEEAGRKEHYRVIPGGTTLTGYGIPEDLAQKIGSAVLIAKSVGSETTLVVVNNNRLDPNKQEIDQHPWAVLIRSTGADTEGVFGEHGDWKDRTVDWAAEPPSSDFTSPFRSTDMGQYIPDHTMPSEQSGSQNDIKNSGHQEAFNRMLDELDSQISSARPT